MQRSRFVASTLMFLSSAGLVCARAQSAPASQAIVTVAFNGAVLQTNEAHRDFAALQVKFAPRQTRLQSLNKEIENLKKQLEDGASRLSEADKSTKMKTLDAEEKHLQREAEDFKADTDSASQQAFQVIAQKLYAFMKQYAQERAYSLVIDRGSDTAPTVWYAASNADITDLLVQAYNAKSGLPAPTKGTEQGLPSSPAPSHR